MAVPDINHKSVRAGVCEERAFAEAQAALAAFDVKFAFNRWTLGKNSALMAW